MGLAEIAFVGDGSNISVQALNMKDPEGDKYSYIIGSSDKVFSAYFKAENVTKILPEDYNVKFVGGSKSGEGMAFFGSETVDYFISIESSKF